jgi:AcrR family transcriptional regulator
MVPMTAVHGRTGRPTATQRPPGFTRERLLVSATTVFAERGFENATLEAIAEGAGVTSATVYRHFDNKSDLLLAVIERAIDSVPLSERLRTVEARTASDFADLVAAYADPGLETVRKLCVELHAVAGRNDEVHALWLEFNHRSLQSLVDQLTSARTAGLLRDDLDVRSTAALLLVIVMGLCHLDTFDPQLVGNRGWTEFLGAAVEELLSVDPSTGRDPSY